jgi:GPH family glycoside/pentoside/hexuronide:cation symporter
LIAAASGTERYQQAATAQDKVPFVENLKVTFRNRAFQLTIGITLLMQVGTYTVNTLGDYLAVYYVFGGDKSAASVIAGWSQTAQMVTSFASIPLFLWISKRWGKVRGLAINAAFLLVGQLSSLVLINPAHPWLLVVGSALVGPGHTGIWILLPSMQADVCDLDELETNRRREGSFNAVQNWIGTLGYSLATWLSGFVLVGTGFKVELAGGQAADTILWMRMLYAFVPAAAILVIFYLLRRYPLSEARCLEIRQELEQRRGVV